ncbi:MAG: hypothetical protein FWG65_10785, partial [Turicibacter sp.]|nr:hypothetical protein [Turicibacter sp.]
IGTERRNREILKEIEAAREAAGQPQLNTPPTAHNAANIPTTDTANPTAAPETIATSRYEQYSIIN